MVAVGRYFVFSTPFDVHVGFFHQSSRSLFSNRITERIQRAFHSPYDIGIVTGICYFLYPFNYLIMLRIGFKLFVSSHGIVIVMATDSQNLTHQTNRPGLLMLGNETVFHLVSLAKKTVAFFRISFSIFRRLFSSLNRRISSCSGVNLPLPRNA